MQPTSVSLLERPTATSYDALSVLFGAGMSKNEQAQSAQSSQRNSDLPRPVSTGAQDATLSVWSHLHFVTTELLTAEEAVTLVDYFYESMAPLTPVISSMYQRHSNHAKLLSEEPILAIAILMISGRYWTSAGLHGTSKALNVHATLWEHLQGMITHMMWCQEHFGGLFGGEAMLNKTSDSAHRMCPSLGGLRNLGMCEALLLLTVWNPHAIHFPSRDDRHAIPG